MTRVIMHGCNGKMGQTISGLIAADEEIEIVAGVDAYDEGKNPYPVFHTIETCDVMADAVIDFSAAAAVDSLLTYCTEKHVHIQFHRIQHAYIDIHVEKATMYTHAHKLFILKLLVL